MKSHWFIQVPPNELQGCHWPSVTTGSASCRPNWPYIKRLEVQRGCPSQHALVKEINKINKINHTILHSISTVSLVFIPQIMECSCPYADTQKWWTLQTQHSGGMGEGAQTQGSGVQGQPRHIARPPFQKRKGAWERIREDMRNGKTRCANHSF